MILLHWLARPPRLKADLLINLMMKNKCFTRTGVELCIERSEFDAYVSIRSLMTESFNEN